MSVVRGLQVKFLTDYKNKIICFINNFYFVEYRCATCWKIYDPSSISSRRNDIISAYGSEQVLPWKSNVQSSSKEEHVRDAMRITVVLLSPCYPCLPRSTTIAAAFLQGSGLQNFPGHSY